MRVEREPDKGYRIVIDTKTDIREMRGVTGMTLDGSVVRFSCNDGSAEEVDLGAEGFQKIRRKMRRADFIKQWGIGKCFFAGLVLFLAAYFAVLVAIEYATSDGSCGDGAFLGEEYSVTQPASPSQPETPETWRP